MYFPKKVDENQKEIVKGLRNCYLEVLDLSMLGRGAPDLLVSNATDIWLVELKTGKGKLTETQISFHQKWRGKPIAIARSLKEVLQIVGIE